MRLTRNTTLDGKCKYAIVRLDKIRTSEIWKPKDEHVNKIDAALAILYHEGFLEYGEPGSTEECFVIKLKDENAPAALEAYAKSAVRTDSELAIDVSDLSDRARRHPSRKRPD